MNFKKVFSQAFALGLVLTLTACGGSGNKDNNGSAGDNNASNEEAKEEFKKQTNDNTLVLGVDSLGGEFIQGFNNSANDVRAREFMGIQGSVGYDTYVKDKSGIYVANKTVLDGDPKSKENEDGTKTITFKIKKDLKWSDGKPVTADDYLFTKLLHSPQDYSLITGSTEIGGDTFKGYNEFREGKTKEFEGVKKIDDHTFEVTVSKDFVPYYEEDAIKAINPRPIHYIAPNLKVEGSKFAIKDGYKVSDDDKKPLYNQSISKSKQKILLIKKK